LKRVPVFPPLHLGRGADRLTFEDHLWTVTSTDALSREPLNGAT
jgi:hypothetical protein